MKRSARINRVQPSPTLAITAKAKRLIKEGIDVVSFGAGEPDFDTPVPICEAAKRAIDEGKTRYTPAAGIPELRAAIAKDYKRRGRDVSADQVLVSIGGKHALYNAMQTVFDDGDQVVIPAPYWVSYPAQVKLAGGTPVFVESTIENDFKPTIAALEKALDGAKGLVLCSPSNPTGSVFTTDELREIGQLVEKHPDVAVFFDGMYDRLFFGGDIAPDFAAVNSSLEDRTLTFNGFSKTYAMTGWRLGYTIGPADVIADMAKLQSQSTSNATAFAQYGALAALELDDSVLDERRDAFQKRSELIVGLLNDIPGVNCAKPGGAFYVFPNFETFVGDGKRFSTDLELAGFLLDDARVAVVPGSAFGAPGFARLSYATSEALITEGISRIHKALS